MATAKTIPSSKALDESVVKLMRGGISQRKAVSMAGLKNKSMSVKGTKKK